MFFFRQGQFENPWAPVPIIRTCAASTNCYAPFRYIILSYDIMTKRKRSHKKRKRRTRRRRIGKDKRQLKRLQAQYRRFKIATGDKRFKKIKKMVKCTRVSKGKRTARIYHRRKCRKNERRI